LLKPTRGQAQSYWHWKITPNWRNPWWWDLYNFALPYLSSKTRGS